MLSPVESEPADISFDRINEFLLLFQWICVVEAQIAVPAEFLRNAEIEADRFCVPDVQVAVRLGRETGDNATVASGRQVGPDNVANEIAAWPQRALC
jgi:hypothetical protein